MEQVLPPVSEDRFLGMIANASAAVPVGYVRLAQNFFLSDGRWRGRGGLTQLGSDLSGTAQVQGIYSFEELDGTLHTLAFANGDMYEYNWGTQTWAMTDLSTKGVTMDASANLAFANSRGRLIVTDGVNKPWMWDGDTTYTVLTDAPIARGVTIYYDKVFFFDVPNDEVAFFWSEEGDPTTGYEAGTYQNVWDFAQTDTGRIRGMVGLNNTLLVLKEDSAANVRGQVTTNFKADAVREGTSETEGTISGRSVVVVDGDVFFLSQNGPRVALAGERMVKLSVAEDGVDYLKDVWSRVNRSTWDQSMGAYDSVRRWVWWVVPEGSYKTLVIIYALDERAFFTFTVDSSLDVNSIGRVEDTSGNEHVLLGTEDSEVLQYDTSATNDHSTAIDRQLHSRFYGGSTPAIVNRMVELQLTIDALTDELTLTTEWETPAGVGGEATRAVTGTGRKVYRRGFNATNYRLAWRLTVDQLDENLDVHRAMTVFTASFSHGKF